MLQEYRTVCNAVNAIGFGYTSKQIKLCRPMVKRLYCDVRS